MTSILSKLRAHSPGERTLLAEAMATLTFAAGMVAAVPFKRVAAMIDRHPSRPGPSVPEQVQLVAEVRWAVQACARRAPWEAKCFEQGLAAQWMLRRRGVPATLYYGLARSSDGGAIKDVWVRVGGLDVIGCEADEAYVELTRFPGPMLLGAHLPRVGADSLGEI